MDRPLSRLGQEYEQDPGFYAALTASRPLFELVESRIVQPFSGSGFRVIAGQSFRICLVDGPQIADIGIWGEGDPRVALSAWRTQLLEGWSVQPFTRLWSDIPPLRPLATCLRDTVGERGLDGDYRHHFVGPHCTPEWIEMRGGGPGRNGCRANLLQAVEPFGIPEHFIRDVVNAHMKTRINGGDGLLFAKQSEGEPGDYLELYAETDLVIGVSVCPSGDNTRFFSDPEDEFVKPVRVEIYNTGTRPELFPDLQDWREGWSGRWRPPDASNGSPRSIRDDGDGGS